VFRTKEVAEEAIVPFSAHFPPLEMIRLTVYWALLSHDETAKILSRNYFLAKLRMLDTLQKFGLYYRGRELALSHERANAKTRLS
jgi:hypothetical protein